MSGFIIVAIGTDRSKTYVSNTSPILWTGELQEAKVFSTYRNAKYELEDNFLSLSATIHYTNICSIVISKYENNIEIGRKRFL